jgi:HNH endonuclease
MTNIFLAPRSNETAYEHFDSTILKGRPYSFFEPYLSESEKRILSFYDNLQIWGNKESLKNRWEDMEVGDYVLFYEKGAFKYSARVILKKFSNELGKKLWPVDEDGNPWSCLYFIDHLREVNIPIDIIQELAEYEPTWDRVQGFMRLRDTGIKAIEEKLGSIETFLNQDEKALEAIENIIEYTKDEVVESEKIENIDKSKILEEAKLYTNQGEGYVVAFTPRKVRVENKNQKLRVAKLEDYKCQLCGWSLEWTNTSGKKLFRIDIDHIIEKAKGGTEELGNLWALCPNCHAKKTLGVIKIDLAAKKVFENGKEVVLNHDYHLFP